MRHLGKLVALTAVALAFAGTPAAQADPGINAGETDGRITVGTDVECTWTGGDYTGGPPPTTLTILRSSVNPILQCTGASVVVNKDIVTDFNDGSGTATFREVDVTGNRIGVACSYRATNVVLNRIGTTREYQGTFTGTRYDGSIFFCPSSHSGTAWVKFY